MSSPSTTGLRHTFWAGPWHYCDRCDSKTKIAIMKWERGLLLCPRCQDTNSLRGPGLLGERDVMIAQTLMNGRSEKEFTPVEKVRHPEFAEEAEDFLI